jgi:hypothetical protein
MTKRTITDQPYVELALYYVQIKKWSSDWRWCRRDNPHDSIRSVVASSSSELDAVSICKNSSLPFHIFEILGYQCTTLASVECIKESTENQRRRVDR